MNYKIIIINVVYNIRLPLTAFIVAVGGILLEASVSLSAGAKAQSAESRESDIY